VQFPTKKIRLLLCCICAATIVGCERHQSIQIRFAPVNGGGALLCDKTSEAKFFIYDLKLRSSDGIWVQTHPITSDQANIHLIETGCDPSVRPYNLETTVEAPGPFNGLRFTVGVPPSLNHADPTAASPPLNRADMFWVWQQGYKFMSIDVDAGAVLHLGSTGCVSPAPVRPPAVACAQPNRLNVTVEDFDPARDFIGLALTKLLAALPETQRCTGNYSAQEHCTRVLDALGLEIETGQCGPTCAQALFVATRQ
jgi:uncharacterized repeat protein (TIGR04052 family)